MKPWRVTGSRKRIGSLERARERWFYLLISPWLIGLVVFQIGPILHTFTLSFAEWPLPRAPYWVGLAHFRELFSDAIFGHALRNTFYYAAGTVPTSIALGLGLALLLNNQRRGTTFFRAIFFLPVIASGISTTLMWGWVFNPRYGLINRILALFGWHGPAWLQDETWAMPAIILIGLWGLGVNMLIYLAALQNIPAELHEAAEMDGANRQARFRHITWPLISPVTFYLAVVNLIGAFQVFTPTYILTGGGPNESTLTLPLYIYLNAFSWGRIGYAATLAFVLFLIVLFLTAVQFWLFEKHVFYLEKSV